MRICQILNRTYTYGEIVQDLLIYLKDFILQSSLKSQVCERLFDDLVDYVIVLLGCIFCLKTW